MGIPACLAGQSGVGGYPSMSCRSVRGGVSQHALQVSPGGGGGLVPGGVWVRGVSGRARGGGGLRGTPPNFLGGEFFLDFCFLWGYHPPPKQSQAYGQRAAGMHPTGMHSC